MSRRFLVEVGVVAVVAVAAVVLLVLLPTGTADETGSALETPWGEPDIQGIWSDQYHIPIERPDEYGDRQFLTDEEVAALDEQRAAAPRFGDVGITERGSEADVANAYNAFWYSTRHTGRQTSLIVDPPDGKIPPVTPEIERRRAAMREYRLALLQATDACKNDLPRCAGGEYGPPSPRLDEPPPSYLASGGINRIHGPEDLGVSTRCLGAQLPDFAYVTMHLKYSRIVQSPETVSIYYDTGMGQGWQRVIPVNGGPHLPSSVRQRFGDSRGRWEGKTLVVDVTNFSPRDSTSTGRAKTSTSSSASRASMQTRLSMWSRSTIQRTWTGPWTVRQEMTRQDERSNRILLRAAVSRRELRVGGSALGCAYSGPGLRRWARPRSGDDLRQRMYWAGAQQRVPLVRGDSSCESISPGRSRSRLPQRSPRLPSSSR